MVDSLGQVRDRLDIGQHGVIDADLPPARTPTLYARFGDLIFFTLMGLAVLVLVASVAGASKYLCTFCYNSAAFMLISVRGMFYLGATVAVIARYYQYKSCRDIMTATRSQGEAHAPQNKTRCTEGRIPSTLMSAAGCVFGERSWA